MRLIQSLYIAPILIVAICLTACSKKLDDPRPDTSIGKDQVTPGDIPLLINGMYKKLTGGFYAQPYVVFDVYSDDIISRQGGVANLFNPVSYDDNNPLIEDGFGNMRYYSAAFSAIGDANFVINYIRSNNLTALNTYLGEALAVRAYGYQKLGEAYGGVVITLGMGEEAIQRKQNTENEVFERVETDLKEAIPLLNSFASADRMSKEAATLLLARLYLNRKRTDEAGQLATQVINASGLVLSSNSFLNSFLFNNAGNRELLFRITEGPVPTAYDRSGLFTYYSPGTPFKGPSGGTGNGQTWLDPVLAASYEAGDIRKKALLNQYSSLAGGTVTFLMKFSADTLQSAASTFYVYPLIRLSEAYLIAAEVAAQKGVVDVTYYNTLRQARNATLKSNADFGSAPLFLDEIEKERRREFVGEGLRWQDMRRYNKALPFLTAKGKDSTRLYLPFATTERSRNPLLEQNKGY